MADNRPIDELFIEVNANDKTAQDSIDKLCKNLEKLQSVVSGLDKLEGFAKSVNALMKPFEKAKGQTNNLNEFTKGLRKLGNVGGAELDNAINNVERLYSSVSKFSEIPSEINSTIQALSKLASTQTNIKGSLKDAGSVLSSKKTFKMQDNIDELVSKAVSRMTTNSEKKISDFKNNISKTIEEVSNTSVKLPLDKQVSDNLKKISEESAANLEELRRQLAMTDEEYKKFISNKDKPFSFSVSSPQSFSASDISNDADETASKFDVFKTKIGAALSEAGGKFSTFAGKAKIAFDVVKSAVSKVTSTIGKFVKKAVSSLKKIPSKIKEIGNHFKELIKKIVPAGKYMEQFSGTFKKLFGGIAVMGLLRRAFSQILTATKEGIQNVAKSVDSYNQSMSMIATSTNYAKNALAASLAPALNAVAPIIDKLADKFVSLTEIFSQVVARITGQATFVKARKVQINYAESLENAGKSASSANKALKEYQKTISAFDEANLIKTKQDTDTSGGAASSGGGYAFDEFKVADEGLVGKIGKMIDDIKAAFKRGDYYEAGKIFADNLNSVVQKANNLDWAGTQEKVSHFVHSIGESINGAVENIRFEDIGKLIANLYNTVSTAIVDFTHSINWESIGAGIANGLDAIIANINVDNVASLLMEKFNIVVDLLYGLVTQFTENNTFVTIGLKLSELLTSAFNSIDFEHIVTMVNDGLKGIADLFITFFENTDFAEMIDTISQSLESIDWEGIGSKVGELLQSIDWVGIFKSLLHTIDSVLGGIVEFVSGFLEEVDWLQLTLDIQEMIGSLFTDINWEELINKVSGLLGNLFSASFQILSGVAFGIAEFVQKMVDDIKDYFSKYFSWDDEPEQIIEGLFEGIKDAFVNVGQWIKDNIVTPFINGFKDGFGIHSPSKVMAEQGGFLIDGLKNGIGDVWSKIKENFDNFKNSISNWFSTSATTFSSFGSDLVTSISSGIGDIWSKTKDKFNSFIDSIKNFFKGKDLFKVNVDWDTTSTVGRLLSEKGLPGIPKFSFFENGGFPDYGEMFVARENGIPEMVGKFGNRPAVANNDQIVAGISKGVYDAVVSAIGLTQGFSQNRDRTTNINLKVDKQTLASLVYDVDADIVRRKPAF